MLTSKYSFIAEIMNYFQSDPCTWGHALVINKESGTTTGIEAHFSLREVPLDEILASKRHKNYRIVRYNNLTEAQAKVLIKSMQSILGKLYNIKRIFLQLFDQMFNTNWFTKLSKDRNDQVCSSYVAWGYYVATKIKFNGVEWESCDPDDIDDHVSAHPDEWTTITEKGMRK
jgi:hypothetical protein